MWEPLWESKHESSSWVIVDNDNGEAVDESSCCSIWVASFVHGITFGDSSFLFSAVKRFYKSINFKQPILSNNPFRKIMFIERNIWWFFDYV